MKRIISLALFASLAFLPAFAADEAPAAGAVAVEAPAENVATPPAAAAAAEEAETVPVLAADAVLATVNGENITGAEVQRVVDIFVEQAGGQIPSSQLARAIVPVRARILEELVMRRVMLDAAEKEGISVSDEEFADNKKELAEGLPEGVTVEDMLKRSGATESELRDQMVIRKLLMAKADAAGKASEEDAKAFYDEHKEDYFTRPEQVTASHILIKCDGKATDEEKAAAREKIEGIRAKLLEAPDTFAEVAKEQSECPSAANGGNLGPFERGVMVKPFEEAAFSQEIGEIGEVVESPFGYHVILVTEKNEAGAMPFEDVKERIREELDGEKQVELVKAYVESVQEAAEIEMFDDAVIAGAEKYVEEAQAAAAEEAADEAEEAAEEAEDAAEKAEEAAEKAEEVLEKAEEALEKAAEKTEDVAEEAEDAAEDAAEAVEEAAEEATEAAEEAVEEAEDAAEEAADEAEDAVEEAVEDAEDAA